MHEQNWEAVIMYGETVFEPEVEAIRRIIIAGSRIFTEIPIFLNTTKKTEPRRKFLSSTKYYYTNVFPERIKVA